MSQSAASQNIDVRPFVRVVVEVSDELMVEIDALLPTTAHHVFTSTEGTSLGNETPFVDAGSAGEGRLFLRPEWARAAVVEATAQRMPYPVDSAAVAVDRAIAWEQVGATDRAEPFLWLAQEWLQDQVERSLDESRPAAVVDELILAMRVAVQVLPADDAELFRMLLPRLVEMTTAPGMAGVSAALERVTPRQEVTLGGGGDFSLTALTGMVDPTSVPARIAAWRGAREPELSSFHVGDDDSATFTVELAADVLSSDREARSLVAWSALRVDGSPWSSTVLLGTSNASAVSGSMQLFDRNPQDLVFGVASIAGLSSVRADRPGMLQVQVDRLAVDAWAVDRLSWAAATLATGRAQRGVRDWSGAQSVALADEAEAVLSTQLVPALAQAGRRADALAAESSLAALRLFQRTLEDPRRTIDAIHRPTLAELLLVSEGPPARP